MVLPLLLILAVAGEQPAPTPPAPPAVSSRRGGRLFISPMGEPFRPNGHGDDTLADWFQQADRNHDGRLTTEEMQQDADRFFAVLDTNHDGEIDPDEITHYEEVIAPEVQTGEHFDRELLESGDNQGGGEGRRGGGHHRGGGGNRSGGGGFFRSIDTDQHQGAGKYGLLDLPEPVVSADADFNRGVSLNEFRLAAQQRFLALDVDRKGYLTLDVLETIRPAPAPTGNPPEPKEIELPN